MSFYCGYTLIGWLSSVAEVLLLNLFTESIAMWIFYNFLFLLPWKIICISILEGECIEIWLLLAPVYVSSDLSLYDPLGLFDPR